MGARRTPIGIALLALASASGIADADPPGDRGDADESGDRDEVLDDSPVVTESPLVVVDPEPLVPRVPRPFYWSLDAGAYREAFGDASFGPTAELEIYPGGDSGQWGGRASWRGVDDDPRGWLVAGPVFEGGASRPRLQAGVHGDFGLTLRDPRAVVGFGGQFHVRVLGPVHATVGGGAHLVFNGTESDFILSGSLQLGVGSIVDVRGNAPR